MQHAPIVLGAQRGENRAARRLSEQGGGEDRPLVPPRVRPAEHRVEVMADLLGEDPLQRGGVGLGEQALVEVDGAAVAGRVGAALAGAEPLRGQEAHPCRQRQLAAFASGGERGQRVRLGLVGEGEGDGLTPRPRIVPEPPPQGVDQAGREPRIARNVRRGAIRRRRRSALRKTAPRIDTGAGHLDARERAEPVDAHELPP